MIPNVDRVTNLIVETAEREILPRYRKLASHEIEAKSGPNDLVTAADLGCEAVLTRALPEILPGSRIIGEEAAARDPSVLDALEREEWVWVIDPVDGTYNFAHGREPFAVIVALLNEGRVVAGWIHDPVKSETITAEEGSGAYLGDRRLHVAAPTAIEDMKAVLYVGKRRAPRLYDRLQDIKETLGPRSFARCVAAEYWQLATGAVHYAIFTLQLPWDHAAGCHIHAEAGGTVACIDGTPYHPRGSATPLLLAPDDDSWHALRDYLAPYAAA